MSGMSEFEEDDEYAVGDMMDPLATDASDRRDLLRRTRRWSSSSSLSDTDEDDEGVGPSLGRELALRWSASLRRTAVCLARGVIFATTGADTHRLQSSAHARFSPGKGFPVEVEDAPSEDRSSKSGPNRCDDDREGRAVEVRRTRDFAGLPAFQAATLGYCCAFFTASCAPVRRAKGEDPERDREDEEIKKAFSFATKSLRKRDREAALAGSALYPSGLTPRGSPTRFAPYPGDRGFEAPKTHALHRMRAAQGLRLDAADLSSADINARLSSAASPVDRQPDFAAA